MTADKYTPTIPDWLPRIIKDIAPVISLGGADVRSRLLTDARMRDVWRYLEGKEAAKDIAGAVSSPEDIQPALRVRQWDVSEAIYSPHELVIAAFWIAILRNMMLQNRPVARDENLAFAARQRQIAEECRCAANSPYNAVNANLIVSLRLVATYFDGQAQIVEAATASSPLVISNKTSESADIIRGQVRMLADDSKNLFGKFYLGVLAKVASVALDKAITKSKVQSWCEDLPRTPGG